MEIANMLTLSTYHINKDTPTFLDNKAQDDLIVYKKNDYGWFIFHGSECIGTNIESIPKDLMMIIHFSHKNGCHWLCLDCDGEEIKDLPVYNW